MFQDAHIYFYDAYIVVVKLPCNFSVNAAHLFCVVLLLVLSVFSCLKVNCDVEVDLDLHDEMCKVLVCAKG